MNNDKIKEWIDNVNKKLGKDAAGKIADDMGILITDTATVNKEIEKRDKQITNLSNDKEMLLKTNASLLQQVGEVDEPDDIHKGKEPSKEYKPLDFRTVFDKNGEFKN